MMEKRWYLNFDGEQQRAADKMKTHKEPTH